MRVEGQHPLFQSCGLLGILNYSKNQTFLNHYRSPGFENPDLPRHIVLTITASINTEAISAVLV
jgi:hypothetical protein